MMIFWSLRDVDDTNTHLFLLSRLSKIIDYENVSFLLLVGDFSSLAFDYSVCDVVLFFFSRPDASLLTLFLDKNVKIFLVSRRVTIEL